MGMGEGVTYRDIHPVLLIRTAVQTLEEAGFSRGPLIKHFDNGKYLLPDNLNNTSTTYSYMSYWGYLMPFISVKEYGDITPDNFKDAVIEKIYNNQNIFNVDRWYTFDTNVISGRNLVSTITTNALCVLRVDDNRDKAMWPEMKPGVRPFTIVMKISLGTSWCKAHQKDLDALRNGKQWDYPGGPPPVFGGKW